MKRQFLCIWTVALGAAFSACSTLSPKVDPVRHYSLSALALGHSHGDVVPAALVELDLQGAIHSQKLVRREGGQLLVSDFHRWLEPLDRAAGRVLDLNTRILQKPSSAGDLGVRPSRIRVRCLDISIESDRLRAVVEVRVVRPDPGPDAAGHVWVIESGFEANTWDAIPEAWDVLLLNLAERLALL